MGSAKALGTLLSLMLMTLSIGQSGTRPHEIPRMEEKIKDGPRH